MRIKNRLFIIPPFFLALLLLLAAAQAAAFSADAPSLPNPDQVPEEEVRGNIFLFVLV